MIIRWVGLEGTSEGLWSRLPQSRGSAEIGLLRALSLRFFGYSMRAHEVLNAIVFPFVCQERAMELPPFSAQGLGPDILFLGESKVGGFIYCFCSTTFSQGKSSIIQLIQSQVQHPISDHPKLRAMISQVKLRQWAHLMRQREKPGHRARGHFLLRCFLSCTGNEGTPPWLFIGLLVSKTWSCTAKLFSSFKQQIFTMKVAFSFWP